MTDEEKAEEIANERCKELMCWGRCNIHKNHHCGYWHYNYECALKGIEYGLAEGKKEKWHDLRKNPNDLPPKVKGCNFSTYVFSDNGNFVYYDYENKTFATNMITPIKIIAWCELPKFEE